MQKKTVIRTAVASACLMALSGAAFAQSAAYTTQPVYVYAGPASDYPVVAELPPGVELAVNGCVSDYSWCDVSTSEFRGWVYGGYLSYPYEGSEVPIMTYGVQIGVPVVVFSFGSYWDRYYYDRPWYHDRDRWANHPPPHGGPPPQGGPALNPRPVIREGGQPQPQPGSGHGPQEHPQPQPGYTHGPEQPHPQPEYGHGPAQQPGYAHGPAQQPQQPAHAMGSPQGQMAHPGGQPAPRGGNEQHGGGDDRDHSSNH
ncbi:peptide-binding protein [Trinickia violacea]|uniref:Peptide-binding protein n=1 Tax=Trinickia violacea TaxID=2571746 RepID=A0A4P8IWH8_9BURK|nr:SH3 domain-containing protein [Trinickia violacea]QCP52796.1 peptide-binding protein [Trinickia violacea]